VRKDSHKFLIVFGVVAVLATLSTFLFYSPPPVPLPNPNGYETFVQAGKMLAGNPGDYETMGREQLQHLVQSNSNALQLARIGLEQNCRIPLQFSQAYFTDHVTGLINLRTLAQALATEGKLQEIENHPEVAAKIYLDIIHLGNESARGRVLVDGMIGIAIESLGVDKLQKVIGYLDRASCTNAAQELESFDSQRQSMTDLLAQEKNWARQMSPGLKNRLVLLYMQLAFKQFKQNREKAEQNYRKQ
jgi:hypothetical protein